jgi:hypothetical protein
VLAIAGVTLAVPYAWYRFALHQHRIALVPADLHVSTILYAVEESWGFGPGGNEVGLIVYDLPAATAQALRAGGISYFGRADNKALRHDRQRSFAVWSATPMVMDRRWQGMAPQVHPPPPYSPIVAYLGQYGFGYEVVIDARVRRMVDEIVTTPGGFYAYGRIGLVIVAPAKRKVIYAYAG